MAAVKEIKSRQESIRNIFQITKAMKLVSTVRLQKVREKAEQYKPYQTALFEMMQGLIERMHLQEDENKQDRKKAVVFFTSNRGLAGGYHFRLVKQLMEKGFQKEYTQLYVIGTKGRDALKAKGYQIKEDLSEQLKTFDRKDAKILAKELVAAFLNKEVDAIYLSYMEFYHPVKQVPRICEVLPDMSRILYQKIEEFECLEEQEFADFFVDYLQEMLYGAVLEAAASENGARLTAMDAASKNAQDLLEQLSLEYHQARQRIITQELTEMIGSIGGIV